MTAYSAEMFITPCAAECLVSFETKKWTLFTLHGGNKRFCCSREQPAWIQCGSNAANGGVTNQVILGSNISVAKLLSETQHQFELCLKASVCFGRCRGDEEDKESRCGWEDDLRPSTGVQAEELRC